MLAMDLHIPAVIATAFASACLGVVAYLRAPDRHANRLFAVNALSVAAWALVTYAIQLARDPGLLDALVRLAHFVGIYVVITFVDFVWIFPDRLRPAPPRRRGVLYLSGLLVGSLILVPSLVRVVAVTDEPPELEFGWPLAILAMYLFPLLVHVNFVLLHKARTLYGVARLQTIYVFAGTLITEIIMLGVLVVLPVVTGNTAYSRWGVVGYLVTVAAIGVAVAKHRLWDLSSVERRAAAAILAIGSLLPIAIGLVWLLTGRTGLFREDPIRAAVLWTVVGAALGVSLPAVYNAYGGLLLRSWQEDRDRIGQLLSALGAAIVHAPSGGATLLPVLVETQQFFGASFVEAYLRGPNGSYQSAGTVNPDASARRGTHLETPLPTSVVLGLEVDALSEPLDAGQLARFGAMDETARKLGGMEAIGANVIVPLRWQDETIGLLVLGPKLSRNVYSHSDTDLLTSVAAHAAIAVKNAELRDEILAEKERTEKVLTQMESGVIAIDGSKTVRLVNPAACLLLSRQEGELLEKSIAVIPEELQEPLCRALDDGATVSGERFSLDRRRRLRVACSTFVLRGAGGRREGAGIVFRDLRTEDALQQSEREAERLRFIRAVSAGMAHEIRNPLVAIRTFAELAPSRLDDPEFRESFLQVAQSEVSRLEELVSQFMTLARPTRMVRQPVDMGDLFESVVTTVSAHAQARDIHIATELSADLPGFAGDDSRLYQAVLNLVLNALDATPFGGDIELRATYESDGDDEAGDVLITVWNSGSYISPDDLGRVFEPFFTSKATGTGLGLAICSTIVDEHGGATTVESHREAGTAFTMRLPVVSAQEVAAEATT